MLRDATCVGKEFVRRRSILVLGRIEVKAIYVLDWKR